MIGKELAQRHGVIAVQKMGQRLFVAMKDPKNAVALDDIKLVTGMQVVAALATSGDIEDTIDRFYQDEPLAPAEPHEQQNGALAAVAAPSGPNPLVESEEQTASQGATDQTFVREQVIRDPPLRTRPPWCATDQTFVWEHQALEKCDLFLDPAPPAELAERIIREVGARAKDAMRVEVPFPSLLERAHLGEWEWWTGSTRTDIEAPLGPFGARTVQTLVLGKGTGHHALIVGRTGSGKTNLMHVIITALALKYSPDELQLYLVDFKKGVGFKTYAEELLPHARVIAIESEREFGLSVLQGLDGELVRRGELFRKAGVESIAQYRKQSGDGMPRILLLVDEFQEFFTEDDRTSREASLLLDRLVRQGRSFGTHVMLGSQSLAGSYSLARSTIDQMSVRIALQCSEVDSRLILAADNPAARLLSRPGEAIYNSASGLVEGNNLFQVALLKDEERTEYLRRVRSLAEQRRRPGQSVPTPIVFEGHEPASLEESTSLEKAIASAPAGAAPRSVECWIGEPVSIRPPLASCYRRQSGSHLLVVSRDEVEGVGILAASLLGLLAQHSPETASFLVADFASEAGTWGEQVLQLASILPHPIRVVGRRELPGALHQWVLDMDGLAKSEQPPSENRFLIVQGLQRARDLRPDDTSFQGSGPAQEFMKLLREGPESGVHVLAWCDTVPNAMRALGRKGLGEFALRVGGVMANDDSQNLLDDSAAARLDRPHRMIFFDEDRPGALEKFRPYALPDAGWLDTFIERIAARS